MHRLKKYLQDHLEQSAVDPSVLVDQMVQVLFEEFPGSVLTSASAGHSHEYVHQIARAHRVGLQSEQKRSA